MAPIQNEGLRNYVNGQSQAPGPESLDRPNGGDAGRHGLSDCKLGRRNGKVVSQLVSDQEASSASRKADISQHNHRQSASTHPVYGTDASSIGDESTVNSADARQAAQLFQSQRPWQSDHHQIQGRHSAPDLTRGGEYVGNEADAPEVWNHPLAHVDPEIRRRVRGIGLKPDQEVPERSFTDKHIPGDTYPSTNDSETSSQLDKQDARGAYGQPTPFSQPPDPVAAQNVPSKRDPQPLAQQISQDHNNFRPAETHDLPIQTTQKATTHNPSPDIRGFQYGSGPRLQQKTQNVQKKRDQMGASKQQATQAVVQASEIEPAQTRKPQNKDASQQHRREGKAVQSKAHDLKLQGQQSRPRASSRAQSRVASPVPSEPKQRTNRERQPDRTAHWDQSGEEYDETNEAIVQIDPNVADYDDDVLFKKQYEDLKNADYDVGPRNTELERPVGRQGDDLPTRLGTLKGSKDKQHQISFCGSLNIEQWEEAGDWFLGQFGDIINKLKTARQERRKASRLFEDEVEARHKAVKRKHQQTEDALNTMRVSGDAVLYTPAKKTKVTK